MTVLFRVYEVSSEGDLTRARGRAEANLCVGDLGLYQSEEGENVPVSIVRIETYGRATSSLDQMWTADLLLSTSGEKLSGKGRILSTL